LPNNRERFPELWAQKEALEKRKAEIIAESASPRARKEALQRKIELLQEEVDGLIKEIKAIENPDLFVIDQEISVIARQMSGYSMSAEAM
jgi:predicted  nucleic acid-binding Zn-ribbon protein